MADFTFATPAQDTPCAAWDGKTITMPVFNDILTPLDGAKVLARFASSYYAGEAALAEHAVGQGRVLHLGCAFTAETTAKLLTYLGLIAPFCDIVHAPQDVELVVRRRDGRRYLFALNYQPHPVTVTLHQRMVSLLSETADEGKVTLPAYGVQVWEVQSSEGV